MADDVVLGTDTFAADEIAGVKHQRVKLEFGVDGSAVDVSASNPLPTTGPLTDTQLRATAVPVSGTVTATGPLTDAQLRATAVSVDAIGELIEAIEAQRIALQALVRTIGQSMPDTAGRLRVLVDSISASLTLATITTVGTVTTVTTVSTLTNQTQIGGLSATEQIPSLMRLGADSARRNISAT